jgi:uncharacterized DUF497 family protein
VQFEWDEAKNRHAFRQRGFGFDYAAGIFGDLTLEKQDGRRDYGEIHMQAIGRVGNDILSSFTRIAATSATSFRRASRKERRLWHSFAERWITSNG